MRTDTTRVPFLPVIDFEIVTQDGCDAGDAWKKAAAQSGKEYLSVQFDGLFLLAPINCAMFRAKDGSYHLVWVRPKGPKGGAACGRPDFISFPRFPCRASSSILCQSVSKVPSGRAKMLHVRVARGRAPSNDG